MLLILTVLSFNCSAEKLIVAFGSTLAPWVMSEDDSGILIDLMRETMEPLGYEIEAVYYPYARRIKSYQAQAVDVVCDINENNIINSKLEGYFSGNIYAYENYAFSLNKNNYNFNEISELRDYSILSWQGARKQLGQEYDLMAENNPSYIETHNQKHQVKMLFVERVEVIQMDKNIYEYYHSKLVKNNEIDANLAVDRFGLFGQNPNGFLFRSAKARNDFINQINLMKQDGRFEKVFSKYF